MRNIAVIFALRRELAPLARKMNFNEEILLGNARVIFRRCGIGGQGAGRAVVDLAREFKPDLVISAGFCGALVDNLKIGDIIVSDLKDGKLFCSERPLFSREEKAKAHKRTSALAVDMESEPVARAARECGAEFRAVKSVSDALEDDIPKHFYNILELPRLLRLKRSCDIAAARLSEFIELYIKQENQGKEAL